MKPIKTLDELKKELMSEHGAVYKMGRKLERFRIKFYELELYKESVNSWFGAGEKFNHWFILDLENWSCYEKPKKIVKEEIEGFVTEESLFYHKSPLHGHGLTLEKEPVDGEDNFKAKLIIEREVDDED